MRTKCLYTLLLLALGCMSVNFAMEETPQSDLPPKKRAPIQEESATATQAIATNVPEPALGQPGPATPGSGWKFPTCEVCDTTFDTGKQLSQHKKYAHSERKTYTCDICGKEVKDLRSHKKVHGIQPVQLERKPFPCTKCRRSFETRVGLKKHLKAHEIKERIKQKQQTPSPVEPVAEEAETE